MADQQQNDDSKALTDIELERLKMYQDSFKHMTTFSSGAILLASAVTGALFLPDPDSKLVIGPMLAISIFLLAFGAAAAMLGLLNVSERMDLAIDDSSTEKDDSSTERAYRAYLRRSFLVSVIAAYTGVLAFSIFAVVNLMPGILRFFGI